LNMAGVLDVSHITDIVLYSVNSLALELDI
jgi:hypothetical protein